jgi:DNA repair protein RecN (Recombination protein N)
LRTIKNIDGRSKSIVFDEVDAGIGGQTADVVARKLKRLSKKNQVICVTHLPQIASYADSHYFIAKTVEQGRTVIQVSRLNAGERVHEIARMISGERKTESVLKHAAELLKSATQ